MAEYQIISDSATDLPQKMLDAMQVPVARLTVNFRGQTKPDSVEEEIREMYAGLRAGETATTAAVNPSGWEEIMEPILRDGKDIFVLAFSSGLSNTYQSAVIAAEDMMEKYPGRKISVVDSRSASLGEGLLLWYLCKKRDEGYTLDQLTQWAEEYKFHLCHWFTVDDLMYLKRGGRISAATALVGTMLKIKPVLHMDDPGHLINRFKVRGRRASIDALADKAKELGIPGENETMFICHGDCIGDAEYLAEKVKKDMGVKEVIIGYTGAVIGSHSGPGTLALFFLGKNR